MPELKVIQGYVENQSSLLASSSIVEKRGFLNSFVNEIIVVDGIITINYTFLCRRRIPKGESYQFYLLYGMVDRAGLELYILSNAGRGSCI